MIEPKGSQLEYLFNYKEGKIKMGLGIGCKLDDYIRFKPKQLVFFLGHDNVGKTYFFNWYMLCLSVQHNIKWCVWSGENSSGQLKRDMIQMISGTFFKELSLNDIQSWSNYLDQYFDFIDNKKLYKPKDLLEIFRNSDCNACLIDPYTGLDRGYKWSDNYEFLNQCRHFTNSTGKTLYINSHPTSEAGRTGNIYPEKHEWSGHLKPPLKDHIEGGKAFLNRTCDMAVIHRLIKHPEMKYYLMISTEKIKDTDSGGSLTELNNPVLAEFNSGKGYIIGGIDPLREYRKLNNQKELWKE